MLVLLQLVIVHHKLARVLRKGSIPLAQHFPIFVILIPRNDLLELLNKLQLVFSLDEWKHNHSEYFLGKSHALLKLKRFVDLDVVTLGLLKVAQNFVA